MEQFNVYTKTYGNGVKEVYLPLHPVNHMGLSANHQIEVFKADPEKNIEKNIRDVLNRARKTVYEVAICNDWDYMITITFSSENVDRFDLQAVFLELRYQLKYLKYLYPRFNYLLVPEYHVKVDEFGRRAIHFHGLISGLPSTEFGPYEWTRDGFMKPLKRLHKNLGRTYCSLVDSKDRVAGYIVKYITKDLILVGMHKSSYICSRGLKRADRHRYTIRTDQVDYFRRLAYSYTAEVFEAPFGSRFSFPDLNMSDKEMFDRMFILCSFFDDDD